MRRRRVCVGGCGRAPERKWARYCDACRWPKRLKKRIYVWTPERDDFLRRRYDGTVRGRVQQIASLWGWPRWVITGRAQYLGLCRPALPESRRPWTPTEIEFLNRHAGHRHVEWIARSLDRTITAVVVQIKRQGLSRLPDGYSQGQIAEGFGVERGTVERWLTRGMLQAHTPVRGQPYRVSEASVRAFITTHRDAFDLRKVDQLWFLDVLCGEPSSQKAVA